MDVIAGKGRVHVSIAGRGRSERQIVETLGGRTEFAFRDGSLIGYNIPNIIRGLQQGRISGLDRSLSEKTDFSELSGTFNIKNGVARNNDLQGKSPLLRLAGEGEIDIGQELINYLIKASVVATSKGQGGRDVSDLTGITVPVRLTGSFAKPSYSIDFSGVAGDLAKREIQQQLERRLGGGTAPKEGTAPSSPSGGGSLKDQLKGLLGR